MIKVTMLIGSLLCVLGFVTFVFWDSLGAASQSPTALIPAGFGAVLLLLGFLVIARPSARKHAMHAAAAVALLGFLASAPMAVMGFVRKGIAVGPAAQLIMAVLTGVYVVACVRSFIAARRLREAGGGPVSTA